ncbi:MAG: DUF350 domain-containing protein [Bacillota bacterium]|nr:DUF350 domain-containing protein [Bacillota bacterium]
MNRLIDAVTILGFGILGIIIMALGYKIFDWIIPADVNKELEKGNLSVAIVIGAALLGVAYIIGQVLSS